MDRNVVCMECQVTVNIDNTDFVDYEEFGFGFVCHSCIYYPFEDEYDYDIEEG
jgi:hypothetical protein